ncbi:unnamed protein product [Ophioblennius macclurei]
MAAAPPLCYHGAISRQQCEELLGKKKKDGAYLIRDSETIQGALCLCVLKQKVVYTYRLMQTHSGSYTLLTAGGVQEMFFKTLDDLICHYKKKNQGLAIHLRHSVKRKTAMLIQGRQDQRRPEPILDRMRSDQVAPDQRPDQGPSLRGVDKRPDQRQDQRTDQMKPSQRGPDQRPDQMKPSQRGPDQRPDQMKPSQRGPDQRPDQRLDQRPDQTDPDYENVPDTEDYVEVLPE